MFSAVARDEEVEVFGGAHDAVNAHRRGADQHVLELDLFERTQHPENLVAFHAPRVAPAGLRIDS